MGSDERTLGGQFWIAYPVALGKRKPWWLQAVITRRDQLGQGKAAAKLASRKVRKNTLRAPSTSA